MHLFAAFVVKVVVCEQGRVEGQELSVLKHVQGGLDTSTLIYGVCNLFGVASATELASQSLRACAKTFYAQVVPATQAPSIAS